jgi:hypothetical protein
MKDKRIFPLKLRAERDNLLTAGACRLFLRLASWRWRVKDAPAEAEWSLSWRDMAGCFGDGPERVNKKDTVYTWLRELVLHRYLHYCGLKGCPARSCYRLEFYFPERETLFEWASSRSPQHTQLMVIEGVLQPDAVGRKIGQLVGRKNSQLVGRKNSQLVGRKNGPPIYTYSLREEMYYTKGKKFEPRCARKVETTGEGNSSLRSKAPPVEAPKNFFDDLRKQVSGTRTPV